MFSLVKRSLAVKAGLGLLGAGVLGFALWTRRPAAVADRVLEAFECGGKPGWDSEFKDDSAARVKRPDLEARLKELFFGEGRAAYILITGEHGTGKSTAVRRAVREQKGVNGAVYVNVPFDLAKFGGVVSEAVGFEADLVDVVGGARRRINATSRE